MVRAAAIFDLGRTPMPVIDAVAVAQ